jgi:hypothetical protein
MVGDPYVRGPSLVAAVTVPSDQQRLTNVYIATSPDLPPTAYRFTPYSAPYQSFPYPEYSP